MRVFCKAEYVSFLVRWVCRKAGVWWGIHGMAIPHSPNTAPGPSDRKPIRAAGYYALSCVTDQGQGQRALAPHPHPCPKQNILAAIRILTYRILS